MKPWTVEEYLTYQKKLEDSKKKSKYGNKWVEIDGIKFQSIREGEFYGKLKLMLQYGKIQGFTRQKTFKFVINGVRVCSYRADFIVQELDGTETVIDAKGFKTEEYRIKRNLMKAIYGIEIKEV